MSDPIPTVKLTPAQFRKYVKNVWDEAFFEGERNAPNEGAFRRTADELFAQSLTITSMEKLIEMDCPKEGTK